MVPRVGQKIGPYEILGRLGSGGMGLVFSAWDARLHRDVAIKLLKDEYLNPTMRSRFLGEARAASRLNHPNICTIFDIGEEQDCPYMVMELLKGETLRGLMQQGPIATEAILQVATQAADALSVAHEQGIVHRDIKPANVVLVDKPNGTFQTKVLDFGLAKVDTGLDAHSGLTTTGMTVGTVSYMSPEQARGELLDGRSDLFSLGVVLYEMATRKLPFDGATSALIFVQLLNHPPEPMRNLNAAVPRSLEQVISTCLQKNRADRYQTAQELVTALHRAAQQIGSGERSASWFTKFTTGLKREGVASSSQLSEPTKAEALPEGPSPRQLSAEEAFLRPFKPARQPSSGSIHYEPVNAPYSLAEEGAGTPISADQKLFESSSEVRPVGAQKYEEHALDVGAITAASSKENRAGSHSRLQALEWLNDPIEAPPHDEQPIQEEDAPSWRGWRVLLGCLLAAAIVVISVAVVLSKHQPNVTKVPRTATLSEIANHTGDSTLGSVMAAGLELSMQQSPVIGLRGQVDLVSEIPQKGDQRFIALQEAAKANGAAAFVLGEIRMEGPTYSLSLHVYDAEKGSRIGDCSSTAVSRERIVGAVDGLATSLRSVMGESSASINASLPLSGEATGNIDALLAYGLGNESFAAAHYFDAMYALEHAVALDPQFTQAHLRLAELYMQQHAEVSSANAASAAQSASNGDERSRLLADGMQSLLTTGDFQRASDLFLQVTKKYSLDAAGFRWLAVTQRLEGAFPAALTSAQEAVRLAPGDHAAANELELALLAVGRTDAAPQVRQRGSATAGLPLGADQLSSFLDETVPLADAQPTRSTSDDLDAQITQATILDAGGRFNAGLAMWRAIAQRAAAAPQLTSSAAYALSQAALDRALTGDCTTSSALEREASIYPSGPQALFMSGMASGLCGNIDDTRVRLGVLTTTYAQSFHVKSFYASDLNALMQWKAGALADALVTLQSASNYDAISFTPYLRGQVYLAEKQPQPATVEFQSMLRHQGQILLMNAEALPMTYLALARAFVANGDPSNAAKSYKRLATLLQRADPDSPSLTEAQLATAP